MECLVKNKQGSKMSRDAKGDSSTFGIHIWYQEHGKKKL